MSVFSLISSIIHNDNLTDEDKIKLLKKIGERMKPGISQTLRKFSRHYSMEMLGRQSRQRKQYLMTVYLIFPMNTTEGSRTG